MNTCGCRHPAWEQLVASDGQVLFAHRTTGQIDTSFTLAARGGTCGGCLCDEVSSIYSGSILDLFWIYSGSMIKQS